MYHLSRNVVVKSSCSLSHLLMSFLLWHCLQELIRRWDSEHELFLRRHRTCKGQHLCAQWTDFL